ncbi:MAG: DUF433 domain-containing protein [Gemmataceae bacterium]
MSLALVADPGFFADADGVIRVGGTRVTLDTVVAAYREGMTPEAIVDQYPSLRLDQLYSVIGYFLSHKAEVDEYLRSRQQQADTIRRENESRFDPAGIRERLLAWRGQG